VALDTMEPDERATIISNNDSFIESAILTVQALRTQISVNRGQNGFDRANINIPDDTAPAKLIQIMCQR
jgi:hypothetical protein